MESPIKFFAGLKLYFDIRSKPNVYLCKTALITGKVRLDIIKFDDWLHVKHGNYEVDKNVSMAQLVAKEYGISARSFIEDHI